MIEAVNSAISNAQQARFTADQVATLNSFAADIEAVESVARGPVAPYVSPYVSVDTRFDTAVLQIRDSDTGDILTQFPQNQHWNSAAFRLHVRPLRVLKLSARRPIPLILLDLRRLRQILTLHLRRSRPSRLHNQRQLNPLVALHRPLSLL